VRIKRRSGTADGVIPMVFEKEFAFEPDTSSEEHERVRDYHSKLVFKDGEFLVRTVLLHNWDHAHHSPRIWICWMRRGDFYILAGYSANPNLFLSEGGKWRSLFCYSTIIVSLSLQPLLSQLLTAALNSCDVKAHGEETRHNVSDFQTSKTFGRPFSAPLSPSSPFVH
jgi:hypothetical protein